jgi:hypothetical protein
VVTIAIGRIISLRDEHDSDAAIRFRVTGETRRKSGPLAAVELFVMPTEDYPGPTRSHPEKEDTNDPPRPPGVGPVQSPLPTEEEEPLEEEEEEEE